MRRQQCGQRTVQTGSSKLLFTTAVILKNNLKRTGLRARLRRKISATYSIARLGPRPSMTSVICTRKRDLAAARVGVLLAPDLSGPGPGPRSLGGQSVA